MDPWDVCICTDPLMVYFYGKFVGKYSIRGSFRECLFERNAVKRNDDDFWLTVVVARSLWNAFVQKTFIKKNTHHLCWDVYMNNQYEIHSISYIDILSRHPLGLLQTSFDKLSVKVVQDWVAERKPASVHMDVHLDVDGRNFSYTSSNGEIPHSWMDWQFVF